MNNLENLVTQLHLPQLSYCAAVGYIASGIMHNSLKVISPLSFLRAETISQNQGMTVFTLFMVIDHFAQTIFKSLMPRLAEKPGMLILVHSFSAFTTAKLASLLLQTKITTGTSIYLALFGMVTSVALRYLLSEFKQVKV
jgi:hypothetical protein